MHAHGLFKSDTHIIFLVKCRISATMDNDLIRYNVVTLVIPLDRLHEEFAENGSEECLKSRMWHSITNIMLRDLTRIKQHVSAYSPLTFLYITSDVLYEYLVTS